MHLPHRYLELTPEQLLVLERFTSFKVKTLKGSGAVIAHGTLLFFIKAGQCNLKVGDYLTLQKGLLVPKDQPLYV